MNLTKEDIRKLKQACERFSETLEEVEKPIVEEGQYWRIGTQVARVKEVVKEGVRYGYIGEHQSDSGYYEGVENFTKECTLLSDDEVEQALKEEAIRRGYEPGTKVRCLYGNDIDTIKNLNHNTIYGNSVDEFWARAETCHGIKIYGKGDWAEILEDEWEVSTHPFVRVTNGERCISTISPVPLTDQQAEAIAKALNDL